MLLVKLEPESKSPVEWTASSSSPTSSTRAFISYLFKPTELDAVNPSNATQLKPQTRPLLRLQATLGSISVGRAAGLIYRACQNSFLHLPATCNNQPHCSAHYTAAADRAAGTLSIYGSWARMLELNTPLLKCFLLWHAAIVTQDNENSDMGWAVRQGESYIRRLAVICVTGVRISGQVYYPFTNEHSRNRRHSSIAFMLRRRVTAHRDGGRGGAEAQEIKAVNKHRRR